MTMAQIYRLGTLVAAVALFAGVVLAQGETTKPPAKARYYRVDFVVKEVEDGKTINARTYFAIMSTANGAPPVALRTGSRVNVPSAPGSASYQMMDVGVNIDCRAANPLEPAQGEALEAQGLLALNVTADISSLPPAEAVANAPVTVTRNVRWGSAVIVPLRKATVVFSSDDVTSKRKLQLELTATPI
jgi:hypothetical protein